MRVDYQCSMWQCMHWLSKMFVALELHKVSLQSQLLNNDLHLESKLLHSQKIVWDNGNELRDAMHRLFVWYSGCCMLSMLRLHNSKQHCQTSNVQCVKQHSHGNNTSCSTWTNVPVPVCWYIFPSSLRAPASL